MTSRTMNTTQTACSDQSRRDHLNVVVVGHVDHGKSTVIGRLLADTGSLPDGKLEQVKQQCARNARPFEYAFLLDALKNEQAQGITIDTARCFFKTPARDYIIHDAPGHVEFLKNMVTGAARAEAALLIIDAREGIQENSKRHGYLVSMLGISQVAVLINKMDLVGYSQEVADAIHAEYSEFLEHLGVKAVACIPVSAREGVNISQRSDRLSWYAGPTVLEQLERFSKPRSWADQPFRMPVQDIYKFTNAGDDRRIVAGTVETGRVHVGDAVVFLPTGKQSVIKSIEAFNSPPPAAVSAGQATGFTLETQLYIKPGELMCRVDETVARVGSRFRVNLFWMGHSPFIMNRNYKIKLAAARVQVSLVDVLNVLDASELSTVTTKRQVDRHDVAECILETSRPIGFDLRNDVEATGRFVIVDKDEIAGCGIILEQIQDGESILRERIRQREYTWDRGRVTATNREFRFNHKGKCIIVTGASSARNRDLAKTLEYHLFRKHCNTYYLGVRNVFDDLDADGRTRSVARDEHVRRLGELARIMTDAGLLFITTLTGADDHDLNVLKLLNEPNELFVINIGECGVTRFPVDIGVSMDANDKDVINRIVKELNTQDVLLDYSI